MYPRIVEVNSILKELNLKNKYFQKKSKNILTYNPEFQLHITKQFGLILREGLTYAKLNSIGTKVLLSLNDDIPLNTISKIYSIEQDILINFIKKLTSLNILVYLDKSSKIDISGSDDNYYPIHCSIEITKSCFLSCKHCYANSNYEQKKFLTFNQLIKIFDELKNKTRIITITGGDPLCHPNIKQILLYAKDCGFITRLNTSGYGIDEKFVKFLKDINIDGIKVSLDGAKPETHNYLRNSNNAFDKTIKCMNLLRKYEIDFSIGTVIGDFNKTEMDKIIELGLSYNAKKIGIGTILELGRAKNRENLLISNYSKFLYQLDNVLRKYRDKVVFEEDGNWYQCIKSADLFNMQSYLNYKININCLSCDGCGAGIKIQFIDSNGNIKPCMMSNIKIGKIDKQLKYYEEKINSLLNLNTPCIDECGDCDNIIFCLGCSAKGLINSNKQKECIWKINNYKNIDFLEEVKNEKNI